MPDQSGPYVCSRCDREVTRLVTYAGGNEQPRRMCVYCAASLLDFHRLPSGALPCCGGWGEHFDGCQVGADIAAARRAIAASTIPTIPLFEVS